MMVLWLSLSRITSILNSPNIASTDPGPGQMANGIVWCF